MRSKLRIVSGIMFASVLVIGFQNCASKVDFSTDKPKVMQSLVAMDQNGNPAPEIAPEFPPPPMGNPPPENNPPVGTSPPPSRTVCDHNSKDGDSDDNSSDDSSSDDGSSDDSSSDNDSNSNDGGSPEMVGCILEEGSGQSLKLGLLTSELDGTESRADSVCVPKADCLGPVSLAFGVKTHVAPGSQGYCGHNPNVQSLSSKKVKALLSH